ncbi:MAG TPA: DUF3326 domain-containing protein [Coleofasciculaceae cyanobacterium]|jgi:hypothetical protein
MQLNRPFVAAMIIPTGVGASIGGFAGDATPSLNLLASVTDVLITHPNVANAAVFQKLPENALYVEGYGLDQFMQGRWALQPVRKNRIGVVFDAGIPEDMLTLHINTLNAVKSVYGVDILGYTLTETPVDITCEMTDAGCSSGSLRNPDVILNACRELQARGATAIALCMLLPELPEGEAEAESSYKTGSGVDPIGGIEGILSHLVVSELGIPCAHAPVFPWEKAIPMLDEILDPRAAAEFIAPTFLPCVLTGLHRAPQFVVLKHSTQTPAMDSRVRGNDKQSSLSIHDLQALVVPANALGGIPVLAALEHNIPIITVESNQTVLDMTASHFQNLPPEHQTLIRPAHSYEEAAGILQALRLGLTMDATPVPNLAKIPIQA